MKKSINSIVWFWTLFHDLKLNFKKNNKESEDEDIEEERKQYGTEFTDDDSMALKM